MMQILVEKYSAHFYLRENFYADSGILTLLIFLKILSEKNIKSSELVQNYNFKPLLVRLITLSKM